MQRMRSLILGLLGLFLLAGGAWVFSPSAPAQEDPAKDSKAEAADEKKTESSKTHTVKSETFRIETELDGVLEAVNMTEISLRPDVFKTLEVVKAVPHGTEVKKGQALVELETKDLEEQVREAELAVELGELTLKDAQVNLKSLEATMPLDLASLERANMVAQRELKQYRDTDRPLAVRSAKHSLKSSEGQLENVMEELKQLERMYKADDLTEETEEIILKRARRSVETAELFLEQSKIRTARRLNESIPEQEVTLTEAAKRAELSLAKVKVTAPMKFRSQQIELDKLERAQEKAVEKLEKLTADLKLLHVDSPASGVVYYGSCQDGKWSSIDTIEKQLQPGKTLTTNQVFMTIVQLSPMQVRLSLAEKDLRHIQKGVNGEAVPTAFPDLKLPVSVTSVARFPDGSTKFDALASLRSKNAESLVPGMTCKVKMVSYEKKNALAIPEKALFQEENQSAKTYVYLAGENDKPLKRPVSIGKKHGGKVEITKGLNAGDKILTEKPKEK